MMTHAFKPSWGGFMYLENACEMLNVKDIEDEYPLQIQMNRCF